jgi:hypothetical protein
MANGRPYSATDSLDIDEQVLLEDVFAFLVLLLGLVSSILCSNVGKKEARFSETEWRDV